MTVGSLDIICEESIQLAGCQKVDEMFYPTVIFVVIEKKMECNKTLIMYWHPCFFPQIFPWEKNQVILFL